MGRPYLLCVECPFESNAAKIQDSGRTTYNIMRIKLAFEWAHNALLAHCNGGERRKSILALLVGIKGQLLQNRSSSSSEDKLHKFVRAKKRKREEIELDKLLASA